MNTNKSHISFFIALLLLGYIYCMLKVYKVGICWCFNLLHELQRGCLILKKRLTYIVFIKRSGTGLFLYVCQDLIEEREKDEGRKFVFVTFACVLQQDVYICRTYGTHTTPGIHSITQHVYLIRQEAAPVTFCSLFMMCRVQCRGQKTDEVEAPHFGVCYKFISSHNSL